MAARYWVGGTDNWNSTAGTKWATTSGGAGGAAVPTAADDVFFDASSGVGTITLATGQSALSIDCTGFTGTFSFPTLVALTLAGNLFKLVAGMTFTVASGSTTARIDFTSTSGTCLITTAGKTMPGCTFDGVGGTWQLQDSFTTQSVQTITLTRGTLNTNGQTCSWGLFSSSNTNTRALTLGASAISLTGTGTIWNFSIVTGLTFTAGTSTISNTVGGVTYQFGTGLTYYNVSPSSGTVTLGGASVVMNNFTINNPAGQGSLIINGIGTNWTINGTLTLKCSASATNAAWGYIGNTTPSNNLNPRTITAAAIDLAYWNFADVVAAGAAIPWTAAAGTLLGDALGNSNITFSASRTLYWVGTAGTWTTLNRWALSSGGVTGNYSPAAHDDVVVDANSAIVAAGSMGVDRVIGRNIDFSAANATFSWGSGLNPAMIYGSLALKSGMTVAGSGQLAFAGRGTHTLTSNGVAIAQNAGSGIRFDAYGGTYTLNDNLSHTGASATMALNGGGLNLNGFTLTTPVFSSSNTAIRSVTFGAGVLEVTGSSGTPFTWQTTTNLTVNRGTGTLRISDTGASGKNIGLGGIRVYKLEIVGGGTGAIIFSGTTKSFDADILNITGPKTLTFPAGTNNNIYDEFNVEGTAGNLVTFQSQTAGSPFTFTKQGGGIINCNYLSLQDSTAAGTGALWYAGPNSTNVSGNSGWIFTAANYAVTKSLQYAIKTTPTGVTKSLQYSVKAPVAVTKSLQYAVKLPLSLTKSLQYRIKRPSSITKSLNYDIKRPISVTKSLQYRIKTTPSAITKSLQYRVKKPIAVTKSLRYTVKDPNSITKALAYGIERTYSITKALRYAVKPSARVQKSLQYRILLPEQRTEGVILNPSGADQSVYVNENTSVILR